MKKIEELKITYDPGEGRDWLAGILYMLFSAVPLWLLWNWLVPHFFGLPSMTYWHALGFVIFLRAVKAAWDK